MELQRRSEKAPILTKSQGHLTLHPADEWEIEEQRLLDLSDLDPNAQNYKRFVVAGAVECPVDSNGRILVPVYLREHAGLENKVIIAGVLNRIEIWNPERYEDNQRTTLLHLDEIQRSVDLARRPKEA